MQRRTVSQARLAKKLEVTHRTMRLDGYLKRCRHCRHSVTITKMSATHEIHDNVSLRAIQSFAWNSFLERFVKVRRRGGGGVVVQHVV